MKTKSTKQSLLTLGMALGLGCAGQALADGRGCDCCAGKESTLSGTTTSVDAANHTFKVRSFLKAREFRMGEGCEMTMGSKAGATITDLRPGQKVTVSYETVDGVRVAHEITQHSRTFSGQVFAVDTTRHTFIIHTPTLDKKFHYADGCEVVLLENRPGKIADMQPGHYVSVVYETPEGTATARQIIRTSATFAGSLTAIDVRDRTVRAHSFPKSKNFTIASDCKIVVHGKPDASLSDLKLGEKLVFSYDEVKGVNVVNRISTDDQVAAVRSVVAPEPNTGVTLYAH